jgi:hypothetical protein
MNRVKTAHHSCALLSSQLSRALERKRAVRRLRQIQAELKDPVPEFLRTKIAEVAIARAAFAVILLEDLEVHWSRGEPFDAKEYAAITQAFTKMLTEVVNRTTYQLMTP